VTWVALGLTALAAVAGWRAAFTARRRERRWRRYRLLAERLPGAVLVFDRRLRHVLAVGRGLEALGITAGAAGRTPADLFDEATCQILEPAYRAALDGCESQVELPLNDRDWVVTISPAGRGAGVLVAADVTERKRRERRLTELASRDPLTGVWNRRRLNEELDWLLRGGGHGSLLLLDLDGFKRVNDTLGTRLRPACRSPLRAGTRRSDVGSRRGDEFAVLLPERCRPGPARSQRRSNVGQDSLAAGSPAGSRRRCSRRRRARPPDRAMYAAKRRFLSLGWPYRRSSVERAPTPACRRRADDPPLEVVAGTWIPP
jgi:GGDEF domain-containing protein